MATKKTAKKTTKKTTRKPAPKKPRMSKSAARAEGAQRTKAAQAAKAKSPGTDPAKPATAKATTTAKAPKERKPKRVSGLDLAAKILADADEPLNAKTIAERAIAAGWKTSGKTPEATLYAAIIREIAKKGKDARFARHDRGLFTTAKGA
ncbi:MAG: winged helix-turn-helix domain-containing protein [Phycisphaeraceae bacterium]|nr:winged helix-turn-helix domain-containing protein [Phycisphaeraceae bacterium]